MLRDAVSAIAKVVIATAFGGPAAGAPVALGQAVDLVSGWLGKRERSAYETALARIEGDLERLAQSEGLDADQAGQAFRCAEATLASSGLSQAEMVQLNLDADRVAATALERATDQLAALDSDAARLCKSAVVTVYASLLAEDEALPGLESAFRQAVLARIDELGQLPAEVAEVLRSTAAEALLVHPAKPWRPEIFPPSALLRADFGIVPFHGREDVLTELSTWCETETPLAVRLYTGPGGMGKTRLMMEAVTRRIAANWRAGFLLRDAVERGPEVLDWMLDRPTPLLIVIDYAETRRRDVRELVEKALDGRIGTKLRLVLLARAVADWWHDLRNEVGGVGDLFEGPATTVSALPPLADDAEGRIDVFVNGAASFARILGLGPPAHPPPDLTAKHFERVLFLHLSALAAVQGEAGQGEQGLLDFALRRERGFWDDGVRAAGFDSLAGRPIAQAAAVATLAGAAASRQEAVSLLARAPLLMGQPAAALDTVAGLLHRLYPSESWLAGVEPDLLGEHLVARMAEDDGALLASVFSNA